MVPDSKDDVTEAAVPVTETVVGMTLAQKRFYTSEMCEMAREALQDLIDDTRFNTKSSYFKESPQEFIDRHLEYLCTHPTTKLEGYISNLRLMTRVK